MHRVDEWKHMLDQITPVILTFNEEDNIGRSLEHLKWAQRIVVVDSHSTDRTVEIIKQFPQVEIYYRKFDKFANQFNFALKETNVSTDWVMMMDADYMVPERVTEEIRTLKPTADINGFWGSFQYCVYGRPLRSGIYPDVAVLFRPHCGTYQQDGHTHRVAVDGRLSKLQNKLRHDDRKPLARWIWAQSTYMGPEAEKIRACGWQELSWADRLRKTFVLSPIVMFFYCLIVKGGLLDGHAGLYYALQRTIAEGMLSLKLLDDRLLSGDASDSSG